MQDIVIRPVKDEDVEALVEIFAPYVKNTAISFEYEVPSREIFLERIRTIKSRYPYLVAERKGELLGYACLHSFIDRKAYDWSAEVTIYMKDSAKGIGLGRAFYQCLEKIALLQGIKNINACIVSPKLEDEYANKNSIQFHSYMGFVKVGTFHNSGYKFGRWYDMVWMEKIIGKHEENQKDIRPFSDLKKEELKEVGIDIE
ncbi:MAG TPA: GNAT family N-acetyltransferase [Lachnospiraceae bacterium]